MNIISNLYGQNNTMGIVLPISQTPAKRVFGVVVFMGITEFVSNLVGWTTSIFHSPEYVILIVGLISFALIGLGLSDIEGVEKVDNARTDDKHVALITGCTSGGIGHALALDLHNRGWRVFATARKPESITGIDCEKLHLDVNDIATINQAVSKVMEMAGHIDLLINNAGRGDVSPVIECDLDKDLRDTFETNVFGLVAVTQAVVKHMIPRGTGTIVNIGSVVGMMPSPWNGVYSASKYAVHALTDSLRMEVKGFGIKVMLVAPGAIKSNIGRQILENLTLKEDTIYKSVKNVIIARATYSQQANSTPTDLLARLVIDQAIKPKPPAYFHYGTHSLSARIAYHMPAWLQDILIGNKFSCNKVKYSAK